MHTVLRLLFVATLLGMASLTVASPGSGGINSAQNRDKPYVILVSLDAFRWDYDRLYPTPNIQRLLAGGTRAERLIPVWPTLTFPNHYTQVTGLAPAAHGLVGNEFPLPDGESWFRISDRAAVTDGRWYGGTPIWVLAETQGMVAASFFWVGSEADVQAVRPTYWFDYDYEISRETRVEQVMNWLKQPAGSRPHLITLYFGIVDYNSHEYGVGSDKMVTAINQVDEALGSLMDQIDTLPFSDQVYLVVVSDHGQMAYRDVAPFVLDEVVDLDGLEVVDKGPAVYLWGADAERGAAIAQSVNAHWTTGTAYTRQTAPPDWGLADNPRFPDVVLQADAGYSVISRSDVTSSVTAGDHGWAPETPEMQGIFWVRGPGIDAGRVIPALHSTDVFPLLIEWLGLQPPDGYEHQAPVDSKLDPR